MLLTMPLRFEDIDSFGHLNNAKYLSFCETHRVLSWREVPSASYGHIADAGFVVAEIQARFLRPVLFEAAQVDVEAHVVRIGSSSMHLRYDITAQSALAASIRTVIVRVRDGAPHALEAEERAWFSARLAPDDEGVSGV